MKRKWLFGLVAAALVVGITLAGCAKAPPEVAPPTEEEATIIPWGTCSCLSGRYAAWGLSEHWAQEIEVEDINTGGGCWGDIYGHEPGFRVKGELYKWNLIAYDYKLDPTEGTKVVTRLIYEDNVKFMHIFVALGLHPNRAMLQENEIFVNAQGAGPDMIGPQYPRTFRCMQQPDLSATAICPWLYEHGFHAIAMECENSENHRGYLPRWNKELDNAGIEVLGLELHETGTEDFTPYLSKLIALNPDLLWFNTDSTVFGLIIKQARELGYTGDIFFPCPWTMKELIETSGGPEVIEGIRCTMMIGECTEPQQLWLRDEYIKRHGEVEWDTSIVDRADPIYVLTVAIEKANSLDTNEVARAMETIESPEWYSFYGWPTWWGGATQYGIDHDLVTPVHMVRMVNGEQTEEAVIISERGAY